MKRPVEPALKNLETSHTSASQAGMTAAAGQASMTTMIDRVRVTHRYFAARLATDDRVRLRVVPSEGRLIHCHPPLHPQLREGGLRNELKVKCLKNTVKQGIYDGTEAWKAQDRADAKTRRHQIGLRTV